MMATDITFTKPQKRAILTAAAELAAALRREAEAAERAAETPPALPDSDVAGRMLAAVVADIVNGSEG